MIKQIIFLISLISISQIHEAMAGPSSIVTIGTDSSCDYQFPGTSLQQVLVNGNIAEIRMVTNINFAPVNIIRSVVLKGGYDNCNAAMNDIPGNDLSTIDGFGSANSSAVDIVGGISVELHRLKIQNGTRSGVVINSFGGGRANIMIKDSEIINNESTAAGGGVYLLDEIDLWLENVTVSGNTATGSGGGIACTDDSTLVIVGESFIENNSTSGNGGGIYGNECDLTFTSGGEHTGVNGNLAGNSGGGIMLQGIADVLISGGEEMINGNAYGNSAYPISIRDNGSASLGGGVFIGGSGTIMNVEMKDIAVTRNTAGVTGGGIFVSSAVDFQLSSSSQPCWSDLACNLISENAASIRGGGLAIGTLVDGFVREANIIGNRANEGAAAFVGGFDSKLTLEASFISANGSGGTGDFNDEYAVRANNGATLNLSHVTVIDNDVVSSVVNASSSITRITNSILYNPEAGPYLTSSTNSIVVSDCLLLDDVFNSASADVQLMDADDYNRSFNAPQIGDYHLAETASVAVDQCQNQSTLINDIDRQAFGFDDPFVINRVSVTSDAGADELYFRTFDPLDLIFKNGFNN